MFHFNSLCHELFQLFFCFVIWAGKKCILSDLVFFKVWIAKNWSVRSDTQMSKGKSKHEKKKFFFCWKKDLFSFVKCCLEQSKEQKLNHRCLRKQGLRLPQCSNAVKRQRERKRDWHKEKCSTLSSDEFVWIRSNFDF